MKMNKNVIPNDFDISLALVDSLPVLFFTVSMIIISVIFKSKLFLIGSLLMLFAGICKVLWKIIVATKRKNIWFLFIQMRITMPLGLLLIVASLIINRSLINLSIVLNNLLSLPQITFFIIGVIGMIMMIVFGFTLDGTKKKNNWIEQITNLISQLCFLIGIIIVVR